MHTRQILRPLWRVSAVLILAGCGASNPTIGGRPLLYKQGPGDPSSEIEIKAGIVRKRAPQEVPVATSARSEPPAAPASARDTSVAAAEPRPQPAPTARAERSAERVAPTPPTVVASAQPTTAGPARPRYTQVSRYGDMLFLSGQIGMNLQTGDFAAGASAEEQMRQALQNVREILDENRLTMANVVSVTLYLANINNLGDVEDVYRSFFKGALPARNVVEVSRLPRGALVEVSVIAGK